MTSETRKRWAEVVKTARQKRGMTKDELAQKLGVSFWTIRSIETGARAPSPELLEHLIVTLGIQPYDLFFDR